jgi:rhodanese-related sulfurtransferase
MKAADLPGQLASHPDTVVVDVRSGFEFRRGHVPGAVHLPFWVAGFRPLRTPGPSTPVVVYCGHGPRAWIARTLLRWRGAAHVRLLDGHMAGWRRAGRPEVAGRR